MIHYGLLFVPNLSLIFVIFYLLSNNSRYHHNLRIHHSIKIHLQAEKESNIVDHGCFRNVGKMVKSFSSEDSHDHGSLFFQQIRNNPNIRE